MMPAQPCLKEGVQRGCSTMEPTPNRAEEGSLEEKLAPPQRIGVQGKVKDLKLREPQSPRVQSIGFRTTLLPNIKHANAIAVQTAVGLANAKIRSTIPRGPTQLMTIAKTAMVLAAMTM